MAIVLLMYPQANHHLIIRPVGLIRAEKKVYVLFRASNSGRKLLCLSLSGVTNSSLTMTSANAEVAAETLDVQDLLTGKSALVRQTFMRVSAHAGMLWLELSALVFNLSDCYLRVKLPSDGLFHIDGR